MAAESNLESRVVGLIKGRKGHTRKVKWIGRRGAPDRLVWIPKWRRPELWELKAPGEPLKPHQAREHQRLKRMGITCRKIDSYDQARGLLE